MRTIIKEEYQLQYWQTLAELAEEGKVDDPRYPKFEMSIEEVKVYAQKMIEKCTPSK